MVTKYRKQTKTTTNQQCPSSHLDQDNEVELVYKKDLVSIVPPETLPGSSHGKEGINTTLTLETEFSKDTYKCINKESRIFCLPRS